MAVCAQLSIFARSRSAAARRPRARHVVALALLRGLDLGAAAGFCGRAAARHGEPGTLGVTSLLLTLAGYWIGRYGETTARDRPTRRSSPSPWSRSSTRSARSRSTFVLGEPVVGGRVLVGALIPGVLLNLLLTLPVYALVRRFARPAASAERAQEVRLLG